MKKSKKNIFTKTFNFGSGIQISGTTLAIIFVGVILLYGGKQGWFQSSTNINNQYPPASPDVIIELEKPPTTTETCTLAITPLAIFEGDYVTGIIQDGINRRCDVYGIGEDSEWDEWRLIYTGTTDNTGRLALTHTIDFWGTFRFRALCGSCGTNEVTLIINELPSDIETCSEKASAGGYFYQESVMTPFDCNQIAITECEKKGLAASLYNLDRNYCCLFKCQSTASPDYCTDTDGINYDAKGRCTSKKGTHYLDASDDCASYFKVNEWLCTNGECSEQLHTCPSNQCSNGACVPPTDSDGDGYSDADETAAGSNPNDPNSTPVGGWAEQCADQCKNINYAGSAYKPGSSNNACQSFAYETCFPVHGLQYEASTYSSPCCCFDCVGF